MAKTNSGLLEFKDAQKVLIALNDATSEVKKAVVIDADGVETDIQGVQPTGKKEITSTAEVNFANYATAQVVDADLIAGNIKKDVDILGVVGSYEAPAGDFSTAEVSVTYNNPNDDIYAKVACVEDDKIVSGTFINKGTTKVLTVPIASSGAVIDFDELSEQSYVISGDIESIETPNLSPFLITGDGTITIS